MSLYFGHWICGKCKESPEHEGHYAPRSCPNCNEPRWMTPAEFEAEELPDCIQCEGKGGRHTPPHRHANDPDVEWRECDRCDGTGKEKP